MSDPLIEVAGFTASLSKMFGSGHLRSYPKRRVDRLCLLGAASLSLDACKAYSETEINGVLGSWLVQMNAGDALDHVTLRRYLIDDKFLLRDSEGSQYRVNGSCLDEVFEAGIWTLDIGAILAEAESDHLARKDAWAARDQK